LVENATTCSYNLFIPRKYSPKDKRHPDNDKVLKNIEVNPSTPELNPSAQRCLPRFFTGILIFKGLTARRLYKSFGVRGLRRELLET
jgi:hypothetical protein